MRNNHDFAQGFYKGDKIRTEKLWKELTIELNIRDPPQKGVKGWKKVWLDWKTAVKRK